MSKINDLIKELCPNGVIYKKYGDVFEIKTGKGITTKEATDDGLYPIISGGTTPMGYYHSYNRDENIVTVSRVGANAGYVNFITEKFYLNDKCFSIIPKDEFVKCFIPKYIYHYTKNIENKIMELQSEGGVPTINTQKVSNLLMPMLPIDVQLEIINILDKFCELESELESELEARKNQYEFWRGTIISNSNGKDGKLIELLSGPITDGPHTTPKFVSDGIPFVSASAVHEGKIHLKDAQGFITKEFDNECSRKYKPRKWDVYMVKSGSTTGKVAIVDIDADFNIWSPLAAMRTDNEITSRYLYHLLQTKDVQEQVRNRMSHGSQPNLSMRVLEQFDIKIPTLEEQYCIVNILDKFDKLINDISEGLPAEIELRRKQYEYYRNKLLSFEVYNDE